MRATILSLALLASPAFALPDINLSGCYLASLRNVPCVAGQTQNVNWVSTSPATPPAIPAGAPSRGTSVLTVNSEFPVYMNWVFTAYSPAALNAKMELVTSIDLARFSSAYWSASPGGSLSTINALAKAKLTAANFAKWQAAFNPANPTTLKQSYAASIKAGINPKVQWGLWSASTPTVDMTMREIYTEFLFTSAETEVEALIATATFMTLQLHVAAGVGYAIGTGFYAFASTVNPNYSYDLITTYGDDEFTDYGSPSGVVTIDWDGLVTNWDDVLGDLTYWDLGDY